MNYVIETKAGLVGYLQGSIKGTASSISSVLESEDRTKEELERYLTVLLEQLNKTVTESEEIWQSINK